MDQQPRLRIPAVLSGPAAYEAADTHASHLEELINAHRAEAESRLATARAKGNDVVQLAEYLDRDQLAVMHGFAGFIRAQMAAAAATDPSIAAQGAEL
ncbi:hypothetical protein F5972_08655 [Microbispora cellulosiformans]|uniref:Uncharacterized protein n=1 Tax=Microbispora cellulosiformans TaxID=2614688 RepID=A0A5J5K533_9ACTN|nr:hypothetical protein [Microbispora cellulosiformans]KAA9379711.1 hypothetical protein F5972_08655 [Microbispora cellulosiformans]